MNKILILIVILLLLIIILVVSTINKMLSLKKSVEQSEANIDVFLSRRYNILTNMQEVVKGYAKHEQDLLIKLVQIKKEMSMTEKNNINKEMETQINKINLLVEDYPELKANNNYLELQEAIVDCEDNLAAARRIYNSNVFDYNTYILKFPNIIISKIIGYLELEYFDIDKN